MASPDVGVWPAVATPVQALAAPAPPAAYQTSLSHSLQTVPDQFYRNLSDEIPASELNGIGQQIIVWQRDDESSRDQWMRDWSDNAEYLGLSYSARDTPWPNASGVYDPLMLECMMRFQSETTTAIFAANGPAKADVFGQITDAKAASAQRVSDHINWWLSDEGIEDFVEEFEQLMWGVGFCGSGFKKVVRTPITGDPDSTYVRANMMFVPIGYSTIRKAPRIIEYMPLKLADIQRAKANGWYSEDFHPQTGRRQYDAVEQREQQASGLRPPIGDDDDVELLEAHVQLEIDPEERFRAIGYPLPYVVTIDKRSGSVGSVRRNWIKGDPRYKRRETYVEYVFIPTDRFGIYGIGLASILGNLARTTTGLTRGMLDAGTLANMRGGFRSNDLRIDGDDLQVEPGEWKGVDASPEELNKGFWSPGYAPPDPVLLQLLGTMDTRGRRLAGNADIQLSEIGGQTPVGTVLAVIERGMKVFSAIQGRVARSLKRELRLIRGILMENLRENPETGQLNVVNKTFTVTLQDYEDTTISPTVDPDSGSVSQRILQANALSQAAVQMPQAGWNLKALMRANARALGCQNVDDILPPDPIIPQLDPVTENARMLTGQPVQAFKGQDHVAHITTHAAVQQNSQIQQILATDPQAQSKIAAYAAHQAQHVAFMQRQEIEKILGFELPDQMTPEQEQRFAPEIAKAAQAAAKVPMPSLGGQQQQQPDPIAQQNAIENQLKAQELQQKAAESAAKLAQRQAEVQQKNDLENKRIDTTTAIAEQNLQLKGGGGGSAPVVPGGRPA